MPVSNRIFGSDIDQRVKNKLQSYRDEATGLSGQDIRNNLDAKTRPPFIQDDVTLQSLGDLSMNFDGAGSLSSRAPFIRMWTAIENKVKLKNPAAKNYTSEEWNSINIITRTQKVRTYNTSPEVLNNPSLAVSEDDISNFYVTKRLNTRVFALGTNDLKILEQEPNSSIVDIIDGSIDGNEHFAIQPGITGLSSNSQGALGLTRKTTINFVVQNPHDFDMIYSKYFLRSGALVFVDFGWDTAFKEQSLYDPEILLQQSDTDGFDLEEKIYGDGGVIDLAGGDMETIVGYVTNFDSRLNETGLYECSVTISSKNSALINSDYPGTAEKEKFVQRLDAEVVNLAASLYGEEYEFLSTSKTYSTADIEEWNNYARLFAAQNLYTYSNSEIEINRESSTSGVYFWGLREDNQGLNRATSADENKLFISIGLLEDVILNSNLAIGSNADITNNKSKNFTARFNSSNIFVRWDQNLDKAHRLGAHADIPIFLYNDKWHSVTENYNNLRGTVPKDRLDDDGNYIGRDSDVYVAGSQGTEFMYWTTLDKSKNRIPIRELFVQLKVVKDALLAHDNIELALKDILGAINQDSHHIFNLDLHVTNKATSEMCIVDRNFLEITNPENIDTSSNYFENMFIFKPGSLDTIIKQFSLGMSTPRGKMQSMIAIQTSSPEDSMTAYNRDIADQLSLFMLNTDPDNAQVGFSYLPDIGNDTFERAKDFNSGMIKMGTLAANNSIFDIENKNLKEKLKDKLTLNHMTFNKSGNNEEMLEKAFDRANGYEVDDDNDEVKTVNTTEDIEYGPDFIVVDSIPELYKIMATNSYFSEGNYTPDLQLKLNLTIYGLNGLQAGDVFRIDYLPTRYQKTTFFQITKVNHRVDSSGWSTELESIMKMRNDLHNVMPKQEEDEPLMIKRADTIPRNIILRKSIFNGLGLRIDDYTLEYSTVSPTSFADSVSYLRFIKAGCPGKIMSNCSYTFKFKARCTNKYLLAKHFNVPKTDDDWKYSEIEKGVPLMRPDETDENSWYYYRKGENTFEFAINGDTSVSKDTATGWGIGSTLQTMIGPFFVPDENYPKMDKWNQFAKKRYESFSGSPIHMYVFPYYYNSFSWGSGVTADFFIFNYGCVIYPGREYYLMVRDHDYVVVPVETPQWMLNRVDNLFGWYRGVGSLPADGS